MLHLSLASGDKTYCKITFLCSFIALIKGITTDRIHTLINIVALTATLQSSKLLGVTTKEIK